MASIRQIKHSKDFDIEDIDIKELETQEGRENIACDFDNSEQAQSILGVYNKIKGDSTKEAKFKELYALMSDMNSAEWAYDGNENKTLLNEKDGVQTLRINNLGGSGLNLAIKDDMSFIFEKDGTLTDWQVASFAKFFDEHGMTAESFEGVKDLRVTNANGEEIGTFDRVYASYTDCSQYDGKSAEELSQLLVGKEGYAAYMAAIDRRGAIKAHTNLTPELQAELKDLNRQIATFEPALVRALEQQQSQEEKDANVHASGNQQEDDNQSQSQQQSSPQTDNDDANADEDNYESKGISFQSYIDAADKEKDVSLKKFKKSVLARGGIMRVDKKCIRQRRMPDGSYVISFYNSEEDKLKDGKVDPKTGIAKHTKRCALRYYPGKPPTIGVYIPQGSKVEAGVAKAALKSMKDMGYAYFTMPDAVEFGGETQGAFWEAAGDQMMCPRVKRSPDDKEGCDLDATHLEKLLEALKKKKGNNKDVLLYKMRLAAELKSYHNYEKDSEVRNVASLLEADCRLYRFKEDVVTPVHDYITNGINGVYGSPTKKKWDKIDVACAYEAMARLTEGVNKGYYEDSSGTRHPFPKKWDYLDGKSNEKLALEFIKEQMQSCRKEVVAEFSKNLKSASGEDIQEDDGVIEENNDSKKNSNIRNAADQTLKTYKQRMNKVAQDCEKTGSEYGKGIDHKHDISSLANPPVTYIKGQGFSLAKISPSAPQQGDKNPQQPIPQRNR